jgi:hypothetical protein
MIDMGSAEEYDAAEPPSPSASLEYSRKSGECKRGVVSTLRIPNFGVVALPVSGVFIIDRYIKPVS